MNLNISFFCILCLGFMIFSPAYAQRDTISTDKLIIIKRYSPTVNDAFKIKQKPSEKDTIKQQRRPINYTFIDVPVASTFTPAKGTASGVRIPRPRKLYENYARFGAGNFATLLADFYSNFEINRDRDVDINFSHLSSQGGIDGVLLDDDFSSTALGVQLHSKDRYFDWNSGVNLTHREVNYYGLAPSFRTNSIPEEISSIDPSQSYTKIEAKGGISFYDGIFKEAKLSLYNFSDNFSNAEQRLVFEPRVSIPLRTQELSIRADFKVLNGGFESTTIAPVEFNYQQLQAGINPFVNLTYDNLNLKLGAKAVMLNDFEESNTDFFVYPDLEAKLLLNQETIEINLGVNGDLQQNTYSNFSLENPFIAPFLSINPTDLQYKAFAGISTKLLPSLSFSGQVAYSSASNFAFFVSNPSTDFVNRTPPRRNFDYQNSFGVVYDDLEQFSISADLALEIESDFNVGVYAKFLDYSTSNQPVAFNLPEVELKAYADYDFTKNWNFSASLFYIGERNDIDADISVVSEEISIFNRNSITTIDGYLDLNASLEYKINARLSVFANANNILNADYNRWQNFDVQGFQILGGLIYQFDW